MVDDELPPWISARIRALGKKIGPPYDHEDLSPISGGFLHGRIVIDAEPWMPAHWIDKYFRQLQWLVFDEKRNRPFKERSLELYRWGTSRRSRNTETWRATMGAWNRGHRSWKYTEVSNFHRDFHRVKEKIEAVEERVAELEHELASSG